MIKTAIETETSPIGLERRPVPCGVRAGWLHVCNGLNPARDGGMVPSILGMTGALARLRGEATIVTPTESSLNDRRLPDGVHLHGPETDMMAAIQDAELVHFHGLWQSHTRRGAAAARAAGVPYLIAAHGMAEPWALRHKRWKKRVYLALVEARNMRRAACLHALSHPEIGHLRQIAPWAPVCFIPNGVDLEPLENLPSRSVIEARHPELIGKFVLLFFGRVHVKKGFDLLAEALGQLAPNHPELHLLIAGSDDGAWRPFHERIEYLGLDRRVTYLGHVTGERAREVGAAADAFILPSYSEGFSMAILEALACKLPTVITSACHFPEASQADGAIVVEPNVPGVLKGLEELLERTPTELEALAHRGRRLIEENYTWDRQAERLSAVYRWVVGGGAAPDAVIA